MTTVRNKGKGKQTTATLPSEKPFSDKSKSERTLAQQYALKMQELASGDLSRNGAVFFFGFKDEKVCASAKDELKALMGGASKKIVELDFLDLIKSDDVRGEIYKHEGKIIVITNVQTEAFEDHTRAAVQRVLSLVRGITESDFRREYQLVMIAKPDVRLFVNFVGNDALGNWCPLYNFDKFHETRDVKRERLREQPYDP